MTNEDLAQQAENILNILIDRKNTVLNKARDEIQEFKYDCINLRMFAENLEKEEKDIYGSSR